MSFQGESESDGLGPSKRVTESSMERQLIDGIFVFCIAGIISVCGFGSLIIRQHYSVDSYNLIRDQRPFWYLQNGRYTWWQLTTWMNDLHLNLVVDQRLFMAYCLLAIAISSAVLALFFCKLGKLTRLSFKLVVCAIISLLWINVSFEEFLLFPEVAISAGTGILCITISAVLLLRKNSLVGFFFSFIFLLLALGCYQSFIGYFIALVLVGGCLRTLQGEDKKSIIVRWISALSFAGLGSLFNVFIVRYLIRIGFIGDPGRGARLSISTLIHNFIVILKYQKSLWFNADGLLPPGSMVLWLFIVITSFILVIWARIRMPWVQLSVAIIISYCAAFAPHFIEQTILMTPRSNVAFWGLQSMLVVVLLIPLFGRQNQVSPENGSKRRYWLDNNSGPFLSGAIILFFIGSILCIQDISYDSFTSNTQDQNYALQIANKIRDYEVSSGVNIKKIAIVPDSSMQTKYRNTRYHIAELNRRIMNTPYSNYQMINILGDMNLTSIDMPESVYRTYFAGKNWDEIDLDQQLVFMNDTAYLALY